MIETEHEQYEAYNFTFADTNVKSNIFLEIIVIINIATFTANVSNNLQVKILLDLMQLIVLWHLVRTGTKPDQTQARKLYPDQQVCSAEFRCKLFYGQ